MVGRWVGDMKYVADWPGQEQGRGKSVVAYIDYQWVLDKKAIEATSIDGNASSREFDYWDAPTKQIKFVIVSTNGYTLEGVTWKKSAKVFGWRITGGGVVDGRAHGGTGETRFSEDGRTMTITGDTTLGGVKNDPLKDVYKKLTRKQASSALHKPQGSRYLTSVSCRKNRSCGSSQADVISAPCVVVGCCF